MEFILINENKIKVMLTEEDLDEFEICADELDYSNTETKRMFWDILNRAKHSTGFDTDGQKVLVQLYPSRHGGCEMFVTKIGVLCSAEEAGTNADQPPIISEKITVRNKVSTPRQAKKHYSAFKFDSLDKILSVCRCLSQNGFAEESSAYIGDDGYYHLFISDVSISGYTSANKYSFIFEFGDMENHDAAKYFLSEHGKELCKRDAVSILAKC